MSAYLVAICEVTNPNEAFRTYAVRSADVVHRHGGKYLVRGPAHDVINGDALKGKYVIVTEFASIEQVEGFLSDEEYINEVAPLREGTGIYDYGIYEGAPPDKA